ncbi:hypothetical protein F0U60_10805 [Archangium minus]|uniref:Uncharacterized protein n=1 Tax=Archangium minus TaxID=83450 RepID=A0ABY9WLN2_9BACT|nr:hypothetical protein F0U60_10805 [Archangium minus]
MGSLQASLRRFVGASPSSSAASSRADLGRPGGLYLSEALAEHVDLEGFTERSATVSGVALTFLEG